jgi:hypothetical protein
MNTEDRLADRYQNQSTLVKIFRCRHYLLVPFKAIYYKIKNPKEPIGLLLSIEIGMAQIKMKYWFTFEELDKLPIS